MMCAATLFLILLLAGCSATGPASGKKYNLLNTEEWYAYNNEVRNHNIEQQKKLSAELRKNRLEIYLNKNPGALTEEQQQTILDGKIRIGMSKDEVLLSWGNPKDINRTVNRYGTSEQWVYSDTYVYFENDKLTSWQD